MNPDGFINCLLAANTALLGWSLLQSVKNGRELAKVKMALNMVLQEMGMKVEV